MDFTVDNIDNIQEIKETQNMLLAYFKNGEKHYICKDCFKHGIIAVVRRDWEQKDDSFPTGKSKMFYCENCNKKIILNTPIRVYE